MDTQPSPAPAPNAAQPRRGRELLVGLSALALPVLTILPVWFALNIGPLFSWGDDGRARSRAGSEALVVQLPLAIAALAVLVLLVLVVLRRRTARFAAVAASLMIASMLAGVVLAFVG